MKKTSPQRRQRISRSNRMRVLHGLAALSFSAAILQAQQPPVPSGGDVFASKGGGNTYSDEFSAGCESGNTSPFKGMNPLVCKGVMAPTDSRGQCSLGGMTVLKKVGNTCYYCQRINPPINGILVPMDEITQAGRQGFSCGMDPADPDCMAVCSRGDGSTTFIPPNGSGSGSTPRTTPAPTPGPPLRGGVSNNPCLPYGPGGYDYCANPRQPPGCICSKPQPPGNKGLFPTPRQPVKQPAPPPNPATPIENAMSACLSSKFAWLQGITVQPAYLAKARASVPPGLRTTAAQAQIILEETAMALQAQAVHDAKYGSNEYRPADARDYMVGWLDHCLLNAGLQQETTNNSPDDPRAVYARYLGVPIDDTQIDYFAEGYQQDVLAPLPLMPPKGGSASP